MGCWRVSPQVGCCNNVSSGLLLLIAFVNWKKLIMSIRHCIFFVHCNVLHLSFTLQLANVLQIDLQLVKVRFLSLN